jgi:hypothetical protein
MSGCYECSGTGECPSCHGVGQGLTSKCVVCRGSGACQNCNPRGNVAATVTSPYSDFKRYLRVIGFSLVPILYFLYRMYSAHPSAR